MRPDKTIPPAERDLPEGRLAVRRARLVEEVAEWSATGRRRKRRRALVLVPAVLVVLAASGFTTYALTREPTHLETIGCFDKADLRANAAIVSADGSDPTELCGQLWRTGVFEEEGSRAPELAACALETGAIGVFPASSSGTCAELGLAEVPAGFTAEATRFERLRYAIVAKLGEPASGTSRGSTKCVGETDARMIVDRELDVHGYSDWKVDVAEPGFTAQRPCAEASFDGARKVVVLVPVWDD
jgi:hypothetical protein